MFKPIAAHSCCQVCTFYDIRVSAYIFSRDSVWRRSNSTLCIYIGVCLQSWVFYLYSILVVVLAFFFPRLLHSLDLCNVFLLSSRELVSECISRSNMYHLVHDKSSCGK